MCSALIMVMFPADVKLSESGTNSSALASVVCPPSPFVYPPAMRTRPSPSTVAVWLALADAMSPACMNVPGALPASLPPEPPVAEASLPPTGSPPGTIQPSFLPTISVNQMLPSGPATTSAGPPCSVGIWNSVTIPSGVIRPMLFADANHRLPSEPHVICSG